MSQITIIEIAGELVVDSRIIAEQLGIKHKTFIENVRTHKAMIEANFGILPFQTAKPLLRKLAMFIKLNLLPDHAFKVFRAEDIITIDPVICSDNAVHRYELILANHQDIIAITTEQAHDLTLQLRAHTIRHPREYM
jgi:hypothetical protein